MQMEMKYKEVLDYINVSCYKMTDLYWEFMV